MTKHIDDRDVEILPPVRRAEHRTPAPVVPAKPLAPHRQDPGGVISGIPRRWEAESQARTYGSFERRSSAERKLVEADTALGKALIDHARVRQEYSELPQTLAADRDRRELQRREEISALSHQILMAEAQRLRERSLAEREVVDAKRVLLDAQQELEAQRMYGLRYHSLVWAQRIGEFEKHLGDYEMRLREQEAILAEQQGRSKNSDVQLDDLYAMRAELSADGNDTTPVDVAIARALARKAKQEK